MKRSISILLILVLFLSLCPAALASFEDVSVQLAAKDVSADYFSAVFGGDDAHQISQLAPTRAGGYLVTYASDEDCELFLSATNDETGEVIGQVRVPVTAGTEDVTVELPIAAYPQYYRVRAVLVGGDTALSNVYTYGDHTKEYEDFLDMTPDDARFKGQKVFRFGTDTEGRENFAVVSADVHVITVPALDDSARCFERDQALYLAPASAGSYRVDASQRDLFEGVKPGDKVLIVSKDDSEVLLMRVGELNGADTLYAGDGDFFLNAAEDDGGVEEYFDIVRLHETYHADTSDLDTSNAEEGLYFYPEESSELHAGGAQAGINSFGGSVSKTISKTFGSLTITDTFTLSADISVDLEYSFLNIQKFELQVELTAKNVFNIHASKSDNITKSIRVGEIPIASAAVVKLTVPVDLMLHAGYSAYLDFTATQTASTKITAGYMKGGVYCTQKKEATTGRSIETQASAYVAIGIRVSVEASALFGKVVARLSGEVGVKAVLTAQSINWTPTFHHDCTACLDVGMYVYAEPSFYLEIPFFSPFEKSIARAESRLCQFYLCLNHGKWESGSGACPHKKYLVTVTVVDGRSQNPISGAKVEGWYGASGGSSDTTDASGKVSGFFRADSYEFTVTHGKYESDSIWFRVSNASVSKTLRLFPKEEVHDAFHTMTEWYRLSEDDYDLFLRTIEEELPNGITVTIESAEELGLFAMYTRQGKRTQDLKFWMKGAVPELDLSGADWSEYFSQGQWNGVGSASNPFRGEFSGDKFTLKGLNGTRGLFAALDGAKVHDVTLQNAALSGEGVVGGVACTAVNGAEIYDVAVTGSISGTVAGGIVGRLDNASVRNCYSRAEVSGSEFAGGIAGSYSDYDETTEIVNCYNAGAVTGGVTGSVCGSVGAAKDDTAQDNAGIHYVYYLDGTVEQAFGEVVGDSSPEAFCFDRDQGRSEETAALITDDSSAPYANTSSLLLALNRWYADNGSKRNKDQKEDVGEEELSGGEEIPESDPQDEYNHWYEDILDESGAYTNDGYPIFSSRGEVYLLTVRYYIFENGVEEELPESWFAPTYLYLEEGAVYDIDPPYLEGYRTNLGESSFEGLMPPYPIDFKIIYIPEISYTGHAADLDASTPAVAGDRYEIANSADLTGLADYVAAGGATAGVEFVQTAAVDMAGVAWSGIGTDKTAFCGSYEGSDLEIKGLSAPLFLAVDGAAIHQVVLNGSAVTADGDAALLAVRAADSEIENCSVSGTVTASVGLAGGLVASMKNSKLLGCSVNAAVLGGEEVGGLVAKGKTSEIINCMTEGSAAVEAGAAGGLLAVAEECRVMNNFSRSTVSGAKAAGAVAAMKGGALCNVYFGGTLLGETTDAILFSAEDAVLESLHYLRGLVTGVETAEDFEKSEAGAERLLTELNEWVKSYNRSELRTWAASDLPADPKAFALPVLGQNYSNWIVDVSLDDGVLRYRFDAHLYGDFCALVALYDDNGRMTNVKTLTLTEDRLEINDAGAASYRIFILAEDGEPISSMVGGEINS